MNQPNTPPSSAPPVEPRKPPTIPLTRPRWVFIFLTINITLWVLMTLAGGSQNGLVLTQFGANIAPLIAMGEVWRLLTANFLHIGVVHLAFNTYALYLLGQEGEALFGSPRFVLIYLLSGLSGSILSFIVRTDVVLSAGASTSIFGLMGALTAFFVRNRQQFGDVGRRRLNNYIFFALLNLWIGFTVPGIDNLGHIGGYLGGLALGWMLCPFYRVEFEGREQRVTDLNSLRNEWFGVGLFAALLVVATIAGIARWSAF